MSKLLIESRGFAARQAGDSFVDPENREDVATFQELELLPADDISYPTNSDFQEAYQKWKADAEKTSSVYEINEPRSVMRAAYIVGMTTPRGEEKYVLFTKDNRTVTGKLTSIPPHVINPTHGGYVLNRSTSLSERAGLKPSDILSGRRLVLPKDVAALLEPARATAGDAPVEQMQEYLTALANKKGANFVIKGGAEFASLHQKYLGEWAAPIALITSQFEPLDQLVELQDSMLEGNSIRKGKIAYNTNPTETLFDSTVVVEGLEIAISSKAHKSGGAAASLQGLYDTMQNKSDDFDPQFWEDPRHKRFKHIVSTIINNSAIDGILKLAEEEKITPASDVSRIKDAIRNQATEDFTVKTQRLLANYSANENHPMYNLGRHALASVARALSKKYNDEDYTDVAKAILNHSNVVQMSFVTGVKGKDLVAKTFKLIWPPKFEGKIKFWPGKNYMATETKGKLCFKIGKGVDAETEEPDESLNAPSLAKSELLKIKRQAERAVGKIVKPGERDQRDLKVSDKTALGREKKRRA